MKTFGIIGTAGRGSDLAKLHENSFAMMRSRVRNIIATIIQPHEDYRLVSGAAAWADHVAVSLFLLGEARFLTLHLPCKFYPEHYMFGCDDVNNRVGDDRTFATSNHYHSIFSDINWREEGQLQSRKEIADALETGAQFTVSKGFFSRNTLVARDADYMIALTFGTGAKLKDGGTADTMKKFLMKKDPSNSYHINLNDFGVHSPAIL